ncbi:MAG: hypothetical protein ACRDH5_03565 [bacterium]
MAVTIFATGIIAGLLGLFLVATAWARVRLGPGGDLTREVMYLKGSELVRPFGVLIAALTLVVLQQAYAMAVEFGAIAETRYVAAGIAALASLLFLVGGFTLYQTLRGFAPSARTSKRREILELLAAAIQSRGRALRRMKEP